MKKQLQSFETTRWKFTVNLKMKIAFLLILSTTFALHADPTYSQRTKISIHLEDVAISEVFKKIESTTEFTFIFKTKDVDLQRKVSVNVKRKDIFEILQSLFPDKNISIEILDKKILLKRKKNKPSSETVIKPKAQEIQFTVKGVVKDPQGGPLPGANILEKGTTNGVTTDFDGNFSITVPDQNATLVVSYVGFETKEIILEGQNDLTITLTASAAGLDEVVVVGYGTQKKSDLTGAISSVKPEDIQDAPITSIDQGLGGRASGVMVTQTSGMPGAVASIRIRGSSSLQGGNEPLYVIDGFPIYNGSGYGNTGGSSSVSGLSTINPSDIKSIEILKDASATSIYGARAANGVVLITTKSGKAGKDKISLDVNYGIQSVAKKIDVMNAYDYANLVNEAYINDGLDPYYSNEKIAELQANPKGTDWQDELFRSAATQNYQLNFSGGNEKMTYLISGNYYNQEGVIRNSNFERFSGRVNLDRNVMDNFKIGTHLNISKTQSNAVPTNTGGAEGVVTGAMKFNPVLPVYSDPETGKYTPVNAPGIIYPNPIATAEGQQRESKLTRLLGNIYGELEIVPNLKAKVSFGVDLINTKYNTFIPSYLYESGGVATATIRNTNTTNWLNENTLNYTKQINDDNFISVLGGVTFQKNIDEGFLASSQGFANDLLESNSLESGAIYNQPSSDKTEWSLLSYLARVNYTFRNRYLLTLSSRVDGSSRFGENNKYALFPSGSAAWRLSNEPFLENSETISNLKLRTSYGVTGNQEIGLYNSLPILTNTTYTLGRELVTGIYPGIIPNPDLKWEKTAQFDIGLDIGLWNNRVNLTTDYYHKKTTDLIYDVAVPFVSGFNNSLQNIGSIQNEGLELSIESYNLTGDFRWTSAFNISFNRNKVLDLGGETYRDVGESDGHLKTGSVHRLILGEPIGLFYGYQFDGIFQNQEELDNGPSGPTNVLGGRRYKDLNGDGDINATNDRTIIGDPNPDFFGGFTNTFSYKGFEFNVFMQYSYGGDLFNYNAIELELPSGGQNVYQDLVNRWTPENPSNKYPKATTNRSAVFSDAYIEDASYLKFKTMTLAYNFPNLNIKGISGLKVFLTGQNLITITDYEGYDPEVSYRGASNLQIGEDFGGYPQTKTYLLGVKLDIQ